MISIEGSASNTDGGSQFSAFRLVTRPNTTAAERIAARMVNNIRDAPDRGMVLSPKFLRELPRRMPESPCVRDSVALYCHVWNTFRRGERIAEFVSLGLYGKAVRSLLRALQSETAVSVETLAAITLLQRTEHLFDSSRSTLSPAHAKGIVHIIKRLGPPEPGDDLHYGLVFENYGTLVCRDHDQNTHTCERLTGRI
jgi:hypothetical protein